MLIYLDDYRQTQNGMAQDVLGEARLKNGTYGDEVMNASWVPAQLYALHIPSQQTLSPELPDDLSTVDADAFLNRIYALASQV